MGGVKSVKGFRPQAFDIHPDDEKIMDAFIDSVKGGKSKTNLGDLGSDAQRVAEHYLGEQHAMLSNSELAKAFDFILRLTNRDTKALQTTAGEITNKGLPTLK